MEVLLHGGPQLHGWRTTPIHEAILSAFGLSPQAYSLTQLRYDLRKMKSTVWGSAPADPTVTDSPPKASGWRPSSFSSTSASVGLGPTACSTTARSQPRNRPAKSKPLTSKLTTLFRNSSICLPRERISEIRTKNEELATDFSVDNRIPSSRMIEARDRSDPNNSAVCIARDKSAGREALLAR